MESDQTLMGAMSNGSSSSIDFFTSHDVNGSNSHDLFAHDITMLRTSSHVVGLRLSRLMSVNEGVSLSIC